MPHPNQVGVGRRIRRLLSQRALHVRTHLSTSGTLGLSRRGALGDLRRGVSDTVWGVGRAVGCEREEDRVVYVHLGGGGVHGVDRGDAAVDHCHSAFRRSLDEVSGDLEDGPLPECRVPRRVLRQLSARLLLLIPVARNRPPFHPIRVRHPILEAVRVRRVRVARRHHPGRDDGLVRDGLEGIARRVRDHQLHDVALERRRELVQQPHEGVAEGGCCVAFGVEHSRGPRRGRAVHVEAAGSGGDDARAVVAQHHVQVHQIAVEKAVGRGRVERRERH
mmetsp:Transcript_32084/g.76204  ORF Transcript_32084/g.76204 Transcript_32084/m.76204 type:complete len:277 (+) Transcript_32084:2225-3055(+)